LCSFGAFFWFWYHVPRKIWQPCRQKKFSQLVFFSGKAFDDGTVAAVLRNAEDDHGRVVGV
jgi:hypothetical protein